MRCALFKKRMNSLSRQVSKVSDFKRLNNKKSRLREQEPFPLAGFAAIGARATMLAAGSPRRRPRGLNLRCQILDHSVRPRFSSSRARPAWPAGKSACLTNIPAINHRLRTAPPAMSAAAPALANTPDTYHITIIHFMSQSIERNNITHVCITANMSKHGTPCHAGEEQILQSFAPAIQAMITRELKSRQQANPRYSLTMLLEDCFATTLGGRYPQALARFRRLRQRAGKPARNP